jgi:tetratricopeptide (TPR) repeat protein
VRSAAITLSLIVILSGAGCQPESSQPETVSDMMAREFAWPEGWAELDREALRLFTEGRRGESTAMLQTFVDRHPDFADGHFSLGANHEAMARDLKDDPARASDRTTHLEAAIAHYKRFRELKSDPGDRAQGTQLLVQLYGPEGLNQMNHAVAFARQYVQELPSSAFVQVLLAEMLRKQGSHEEATDVMLQVLQRFPSEKRDVDLSQEFLDHVEESPQLPRSTAERLVSEALASAERQIAVPSTRGGGLLAKSLALRTAARRLEQDPKRQQELTAESERLLLEGLALMREQ